MVPFSFDSVSQSAQLESLNLSTSHDIVKAAQDSFEAHLRQAPPAQETDRAARTDVEREQPNRSEEPPFDSQDAHAANAQETGTDERGAAERDSQGEESSRAADESDLASDEERDSEDETAVVVTLHVQQEFVDEALAVEAVADDEVVAVDDGSEDTETTSRQRAQTLKAVDAGDDVEIVDAESESDAATERTAEANRLRHAAEPESDAAAGAARQPAQASETDASAEAVAAATTDGAANARRDVDQDRRSDRTDRETSPADVALRTAADTLAGETESEDGTSGRRRPRDSSVQGANATSDVEGAAPNAPSRFAQHLLARGAAPGDRGLQTTEVDQRRFVDRVARAIQTANGQEGTLRLRLSPPELGSLRLEVTVQNGALTAKVEAESPLARSLLLDNLPILRERLEEQGVRVEQFDVDLLDRQTAETHDGLDQRNNERDEAATDGEPQTAAQETSERSEATTTARPDRDEQLNVVV